ncbi:MAG: EVE domain-containing protein [Pirellulales bacterium]
MFQADPKIYDIVEALKNLDQMSWSTRQHKDEIHEGDQVYIWESGENGGLRAAGTVTSDPSERSDLPEEEPYYVSRPEKTTEMRVTLRVDRVVDPPITRSDLKREPALRSLGFLRQAQGTNFALNADEADILECLSSARPGFAEIVQRYCDDGIVFQSKKKDRRYAILSVDETGCEVARLATPGNERCTTIVWQGYRRMAAFQLMS